MNGKDNNNLEKTLDIDELLVATKAYLTFFLPLVLLTSNPLTTLQLEVIF